MSDFWYFVLRLFYSVYTIDHNATRKEKSSTRGTFIATFFLCSPIWDLCYVDYWANSSGFAYIKKNPFTPDELAHGPTLGINQFILNE